MSGDPTNRNEDELLSQIDELKARMDRLMSGGTSTSNSALLTDEVKPASGPPRPGLVDQAVDPAPTRTRVGDLIGPVETEVVENYVPNETAIPFPDGNADDTGNVVAESEPVAEQSEPADEESGPSLPLGGSVINVDSDGPQPRPRVASFDDLGSAIQEELSKDSSVPPEEKKKGPDLASRFGPSEESLVSDDLEVETTEEDDLEEVAAEPAEDPEVEADYEPDSGAELESDEPETSGRNNMGLVAAIWVIVALASGAIATLHFAGVI